MWDDIVEPTALARLQSWSDSESDADSQVNGNKQLLHSPRTVHGEQVANLFQVSLFSPSIPDSPTTDDDSLMKNLFLKTPMHQETSLGGGHEEVEAGDDDVDVRWQFDLNPIEQSSTSGHYVEMHGASMVPQCVMTSKIYFIKGTLKYMKVWYPLEAPGWQTYRILRY